ncbi:MAG TPA: OB-fold domain-containing protein [Pseudomonadales bacterium]
MTATITPSAPRILPVLDERNRPFWTGGRDGKLLILRDQRTGRWVHPPERVPPEAVMAQPRPVGAASGRESGASRSRPKAAPTGYLVAEPVSGKGHVFTYTVNHHVYHPEVPVPYVIALVELDEQEGLRLPANIVNCAIEDVHIGLRVRVAFEAHGEVFVPVFEPDV